MKNQEEYNSIKEVRDAIDEIDLNILKLFGDRSHCVEAIVRFKNDKDEVIAQKRQDELIASRRKWAKSLDLDPDLFEKIFRILINSNIEKELQKLKEKEAYNQ